MIDIYGNEIQNAYIDPKKIILLDLNYTLVANSQKCYGSYPKRIYQQNYEDELIKMIEENYVILITARPEKFKEETLAHIKKLTGFEPDESYWNFRNDWSMTPPEIKQYWLTKEIFFKHGSDPRDYFAIESNVNTRRMYNNNGIKAVRKQEILGKYDFSY